MITPRLSFNLKAFDDIRSTAQKAPGLMSTAFNRQMGRINAQFRAEMKAQEPGPSHRPAIWKSARQLRAYFATNGFGAGIPYRRTGQLLDSWHVTHDGADGEGVVTIENTSPAARFVIGKDQQPQHIATGWRRAEPTLEKYEGLIQERIVETWRTVAMPEI